MQAPDVMSSAELINVSVQVPDAEFVVRAVVSPLEQRPE